MSEFKIQDGTGEGYKVKVDDDYRLHVQAVTIPDSEFNGQFGKAFVLHSGYTTLSTGSYSAMFYVKNTSTTEEIHINTIRTCSTATGADQYTQWRLYKNPTAGTIIDTATAATAVNSNFGSTTSLTGTVYKGTDGATFTDGTMMATWTDASPGHSEQKVNGLIVLPPGQSIGLEAQPSASSIDACTSWTVWQHKVGL